MSKDSTVQRKQRIKLKSTFFRDLKQKSRTRDLEEIVEMFKIDNIIGLTDLAKVADVLNKYTQSEKEQLIETLVQKENHFQIAVGLKLAIESKWWIERTEEAIQLIRKYGVDKFWQLRDLSAELLANLVMQDKEKLKVLHEFAVSKDIRERQLATNAMKLVIKLEEDLTPYREIIMTLLNDEDFLVRNNIAYSGFGSVGLKYHPEKTMEFIQGIADTQEERIRETVLAVLSHDLALKFKDIAFRILEKYLDDNRNAIRRMRHSVFLTLCKEYRDDVRRFLEGRIESEEALEHWANLSAEGLFDTQ